MGLWRRRNIVYIEYQTVSPIVGIRSLSLVSECASPFWTKKGEEQRVREWGRGGGTQFGRLKKKAWHSVYSVGGSVLSLCAPVELVYTTVHE